MWQDRWSTDIQTEAQEGNQTWLETHTFPSPVGHGWFVVYQEFGLWQRFRFIKGCNHTICRLLTHKTTTLWVAYVKIENLDRIC